MKTIDVIRAWKDHRYRDSLSEAEKASLPDHPAGLITISDEELGLVAGGLTLNGPRCSAQPELCSPFTLPSDCTYNVNCGNWTASGSGCGATIGTVSGC